MAKSKITFECKEDYRKMNNEILLEYYAVLFMSIQNGNDVSKEWMKVKKEILGRMEKNIYATAISSLNQSVSLMRSGKDRHTIRVYFHSILGKIDILHACEIISHDEKQFWEDVVYKAYGFE